jgi:hypothetical protein
MVTLNARTHSHACIQGVPASRLDRLHGPYPHRKCVDWRVKHVRVLGEDKWHVFVVLQIDTHSDQLPHRSCRPCSFIALMDFIALIVRILAQTDADVCRWTVTTPRFVHECLALYSRSWEVYVLCVSVCRGGLRISEEDRKQHKHNK